MAATGAILDSGYLRSGYIRSPRADLGWFVALPFAAVLIATGFHHFLPFMAQVSIAVWVTIPHHYATWIRSYGMREDFSRWKDRLVLGPSLLIGSVILGSAFTPLTLALVLMLWDHQHSMMQQHGFARIYDFKAGTGSPTLRRLDLWLSLVLYGNLLVTGPLWSELWIAELYEWNLPVGADAILRIQSASWTATGVFLAGYVAYLLAGLARGQRINPLKYVFLGASYGLWYYVSWQDSFVIYTVAHRIMHGVQYIVFVYWYLGRKVATTGSTPRLLSSFGPGRFLLLAAVYAVVFQVAVGSGLADFSFGLVQALQEHEYLRFTPEKATGFYAATAVSAAAAVHYYVDSFIWKVSDSKTQQGL